jgi:hypothetical protein
VRCPSGTIRLALAGHLGLLAGQTPLKLGGPEIQGAPFLAKVVVAVIDAVHAAIGVVEYPAQYESVHS